MPRKSGWEWVTMDLQVDTQQQILPTSAISISRSEKSLCVDARIDAKCLMGSIAPPNVVLQRRVCNNKLIIELVSRFTLCF